MTFNIQSSVKELSSERSYDTTNRYVSNRLSLWCPICGVQEGKGCKPVGGLRFASHDAYALGTVPKPVILPEAWENPLRQGMHVRHKYKPDVSMGDVVAAKKSTGVKWAPNGWVQ
jgi:hypothetical protein